MSLTNPKTYVTEERLNEYHNTILPYLGGMPDILANKFARGDMYSTDEKMIGRWIDRKPLYQKTVDCGALPNSSTKYVNLGISSDSIIYSVNCFGIDTRGFGGIPIPYVDDAGKSADMLMNLELNSGTPSIRFITSSNKSAYNAYVTIQYTKTTDSPVEIGIDTDYSTTEKIVGTWIDGKPIYQKTFDLSVDIEISNKSWTNVGISGTNISNVVLANSASNIDARYFPLNVAKINGALQFLAPRDNSGIDIRYITLQYTKTTD